MRQSVGLHLIFLPLGGGDFEKTPLNLDDEFRTIAESNDATLKETAFRNDHIHILVECSDEGSAAEFISKSMEACEKQGLTCSDRVHVTLLPPWHLEILGSYLRDQDRYHANHTLEEEIEAIFRPNSVEQNIDSMDLN